MGRRLYVGGLPYESTEAELLDAFKEIGPVSSATIMTDKFTGKSRGFGFVEMETEADAIAATKALDGAEFGGRHLKVNEARPLNAGGRSPGGGNDFRGGGKGGGNARRDRGRRQSFDDNRGNW